MRWRKSLCHRADTQKVTGVYAAAAYDSAEGCQLQQWKSSSSPRRMAAARA